MIWVVFDVDKSDRSKNTTLLKVCVSTYSSARVHLECGINSRLFWVSRGRQPHSMLQSPAGLRH